jgi:hypothetical protein
MVVIQFSFPQTSKIHVRSVNLRDRKLKPAPTCKPVHLPNHTSTKETDEFTPPFVVIVARNAFLGIEVPS